MEETGEVVNRQYHANRQRLTLCPFTQFKLPSQRSTTPSEFVVVQTFSMVCLNDMSPLRFKVMEPDGDRLHSTSSPPQDPEEFALLSLLTTFQTSCQP